MNRKENKMGDQHIQAFDQPLTFDCKQTLDILFNTLEVLEGYITKTGRGINNQFYGTGRSIKDYSGTAWDCQDTFLIQLMTCTATFNEKTNPDLSFPIQQLAKNNFYKWIYLSKIPVDRDLAHFLIAMHDTLEGEREKILNEVDTNRPKAKNNPTVNDHISVFTNYQREMHKSDQVREEFGNKKLNEMKVPEVRANIEEGKSDKEICEEGEKIFREIEAKYRHEHKQYNLFSPYNEQQRSTNMEVDSPSHGGDRVSDSNNSSLSQNQQKSNLTKNIFIGSSILLGTTSLILLYFKLRKSKVGRR